MVRGFRLVSRLPVDLGRPALAFVPAGPGSAGAFLASLSRRTGCPVARIPGSPAVAAGVLAYPVGWLPHRWLLYGMPRVLAVGIAVAAIVIAVPMATLYFRAVLV
jgi:hypothetical protein